MAQAEIGKKHQKILVTGANGFVGQKLMQMCPDTVASPSLRNVTQEELMRIVEESGAEIIIHTAAISDIGVCQSHPEDSYFANVQIPLFLANAARGRKLICFSSDQVYSGCAFGEPFREDTVNPANIYAEHKIEMEQRVLDLLPDAVMLRAEWMYDYHSQRHNYFDAILSAEKTVSASSCQYRGVTYLTEVAENMERVISLPGGAYNFGSETEKSMYEITREFVALLGMDLQVKDTLSHHSLWMNCEKARKFGVVFSEASQGLVRCAMEHGLVKSER